MPEPGRISRFQGPPSRRLAARFLAIGWTVLVCGVVAVIAIVTARHRVDRAGASTLLVVGIVAVFAASAALLGVGVGLGAAALPRRVRAAPWFVFGWGMSVFGLVAVAAVLAIASCPL
jgi:hypothetical protein